jgi:sucrose-6-phosphate hydrolase SacC (GH32 family)
MLAAGLAPAAAPPAPPANAAAQKPSPPGESQKVAAMPTPKMYFGDAKRHGRPFAKDPSVIRLGGRYLMYYSMAPSSDPKAPKGWAVGIAESRDLVAWKKVGELLPQQECEKNGLVNGRAIVLDGKVHLFYNTYGNGKDDALCHATSDDGLRFARDPTNPIVRPTGDWNSGRAIDCDVFEHQGRLYLLYATRDPTMKTQMLALAVADRMSDFGRAAWKQVGDGPVLKPERPWETRCIEAPSVVRRDGTLYLFYGGGYNNDPQQIGCATSADGVHWTRLFQEPLLPNGKPGSWNSSESGHPGVFVDEDGQTYLFYQGNNDKGKTWFLSWVKLGWKDGKPFLLDDGMPAPPANAAARTVARPRRVALRAPSVPATVGL